MRCTCSHIRDSHATVPEKSFCLIGGCPCQSWEVEEELTPLQKIDHVINDWDQTADALQIAKALRAVIELHQPVVEEINTPDGIEEMAFCGSCHLEWYSQDDEGCPTIRAIERGLA